MVTIRCAAKRGSTRLAWLDSRHTFSFGEYYDPKHERFGVLRVINEDVIAPAGGFPTHPHRDMEIVTWVLDGALAHRDSLGNGSTIHAGDAQVMHAGSGIAHSEYNASDKTPAHILQIWIEPAQRGVKPGYDQQSLPPGEADDRLAVIASPPGGEGLVNIHQDALVLVGRLRGGVPVTHALGPGRAAWIQVARGGVCVNGTRLCTGDGAAVTGETEITLKADGSTEVLVFDLPAPR